MKIKSLTALGGFALLSFTVLSGCATSPDARLYVLEQSKKAPLQSSLGPDISVLVSPVVLPDYLKRPEIVFKSGGSRIVVNEFDRWAGSLEDNVTSVITANIAEYLNTDKSFNYFANFTAQPDVTVRISVMNFGRINASTAVLNVSWELSGSRTTQSRLFTDKFTASIQRATTDTNDLSPETRAMSQTLDQLSQKISDQIRQMVNQTPS